MIAYNKYIVSLLAIPMKEEEEKEGKKTIDIGKEAAIEAEVRAARERAIVPLETRIKSFRDMLAEKDVNYYILCQSYV
jgi:transcription elongation regulator 1